MKNINEKDLATDKLVKSFSTARTRRKLLQGAIAGTAGAAVVGAGALYFRPTANANVLKPTELLSANNTKTNSLFKTANHANDSAVTILTVARTAEQLAVTFYTNGVANADKLGIKGNDLENIKAFLIEEQIHQQFFKANGGQSLAETFSFPQGAQTFTDLKTFIATQQQLEGVFDSAFLAAIIQFAQMGRPDLAQISGQIATVEAEHRALGRQLGGFSPASNWAFSPVVIGTVGEAPAVVQKAGFLSPTSGNSYTYHEVSTDDPGIEQRKPFTASNTAVGNG